MNVISRRYSEHLSFDPSKEANVCLSTLPFMFQRRKQHQEHSVPLSNLTAMFTGDNPKTKRTIFRIAMRRSYSFW